MSKKPSCPPQQHTLTYGGREIRFSVQFTPCKRLSITVHPDMRVEVRAPLGKAPKEVVARVRRRAGWIAKRLDGFEKYQPLPTEREYVSGETHIYLGRQYRLKIVRDEHPAVRLVGRFFWVHTPDRDNRDKTRRLVERWYRKHARAVFDRHMDMCYAAAKKAGVPRADYQIRRMKKRWASCTPSGRILLNLELVKVPVHCVDYVMTHELCHLVEANHGPRFRRLLSRIMPDWEERKKRLDAFVMC